MRIRVSIYPNRRVKELELKGAKVKVIKLLRILGYSNPYRVVVRVNGEVITEDDDIKEGDEVEIYEVISSG